MTHIKLPALKLITVCFCLAILLSMSAYAMAADIPEGNSFPGKKSGNKETTQNITRESAQNTGKDAPMSSAEDTHPKSGSNAHHNFGTPARQGLGRGVHHISDSSPRTISGRSARHASGSNAQLNSGRSTRHASGSNAQPNSGRSTQYASRTDARLNSGRSTQYASGTDARTISGHGAHHASGTDARLNSGHSTQYASGTDARTISGRGAHHASGTDTQLNSESGAPMGSGDDDPLSYNVDNQQYAAMDSLQNAKTGSRQNTKTESQKTAEKKSRKNTKTESAQNDVKQSQQNTVSSSAVTLCDGDAILKGTYTAEQTDESVLEASGSVKAEVTGAMIQKLSGGASSADASSFRGINAAVRVYGDASVTLTDCEIQAEAENATGVFAYENGTVDLLDCTVTVSGGGAGGVQVAGGGTLTGRDLTVTSASKAAIRSDRGGGTMVLDGGNYTSTGSNGCPAIYSTADITVRNAECVSENSRAVIIEGKNSVTLENCTLSGNDQSTKEGSVRANVLLYQSASGDASVGTSVFSMTGGSMKAHSGAMFYCTNTASRIFLSNAVLELAEGGHLLIVSSGRWGKEGSNGGTCSLDAREQELEGDILVDAISSLTMDLHSSSFCGSIQGEGSVSVSLDAGSSWVLTGDSAVSALDGDLSGLDLNGWQLYVNGAPYSE